MKKPKVGQWVRVRYDDVGVRDVLVLEKRENLPSLRVFDGDCESTIELSQIVSLGPMIKVPSF